MPSIERLLGSMGFAFSAAPLALLIYLLLVLDARRPGSRSADDDQLGLKTIGAALIVAGAGMFASGLQRLLHLLLTLDAFWERFKDALPDLAVGAVALGAVIFVLFPQTNVDSYPKAKRLAAGAIAVPSAILTLATLSLLIGTLLDWPSWTAVASALTSLITALLMFGASTYALAQLSGVDTASDAADGARPAPQVHPAQQPQPPARAQQPQPGAYAQPQPGAYAQPQPGAYPPAPAGPHPWPPATAPAPGAHPQGQPPPPGPPRPPGRGWTPG